MLAVKYTMQTFSITWNVCVKWGKTLTSAVLSAFQECDAPTVVFASVVFHVQKNSSPQSSHFLHSFSVTRVIILLKCKTCECFFWYDESRWVTHHSPLNFQFLFSFSPEGVDVIFLSHVIVMKMMTGITCSLDVPQHGAINYKQTGNKKHDSSYISWFRIFICRQFAVVVPKHKGMLLQKK